MTKQGRHYQPNKRKDLEHQGEHQQKVICGTTSRSATYEQSHVRTIDSLKARNVQERIRSKEFILEVIDSVLEIVESNK